MKERKSVDQIHPCTRNRQLQDIHITLEKLIMTDINTVLHYFEISLEK